MKIPRHSLLAVSLLVTAPAVGQTCCTTAGFQSYAPRVTGQHIAAATHTSVDFTPDGTGGYNVDRFNSAFDTNPGMPLTFLAGISAPQPLGFSFTMPGGAVVTDIIVDSFGRVLASSAPQSTQNLANFLTGPPVLAPLWRQNLGSGSRTFYADPSGTFATVTWNTPRYTFQAILRNDSSFSFVYVNLEGAVGLVGCSSGGGATDPGEFDFAVYPLATAGNPTIYEQWINTEGNPSFNPDMQLDLSNRTTNPFGPGATIEADMAGMTSQSTAVVLLIGFNNPAIDLSPIGMTGSLVVYPDLMISLPVGLTATFSIPVQVSSMFVGAIDIYLQGIALEPDAGPLGVTVSNGQRYFFELACPGIPLFNEPCTGAVQNACINKGLDPCIPGTCSGECIES